MLYSNRFSGKAESRLPVTKSSKKLASYVCFYNIFCNLGNSLNICRAIGNGLFTNLLKGTVARCMIYRLYTGTIVF